MACYSHFEGRCIRSLKKMQKKQGLSFIRKKIEFCLLYSSCFQQQQKHMSFDAFPFTVEKGRIGPDMYPSFLHLVFKSNGVTIWQNDATKHQTIDLMNLKPRPYTSSTNNHFIFLMLKDPCIVLYSSYTIQLYTTLNILKAIF